MYFTINAACGRIVTMKEPIRERNVDFTDPSRTRVKARGFEGEIEFFDKGEYPGVRFKDWKFKDVDSSVKDGALIEVEPGGRTPVQLVDADKVFSDIPLSGDLIFVHLNNDDFVNIYRFKSWREKDKSYLFEICKGEIMCWFALREQQKPVELMEYEEPGFNPSDLINIDPGTKEVSGRKIPPMFWEIIKVLESGRIGDVPVPIVELDKLG